MELFKLIGTIVVNNSEANSAIDNTNSKAQSFADQMSSGFKKVGEKAANLGRKMTFGLTTPITLIGTKAIQTTADFESAMSEVAAISGATGEDLAALETKAKQMGETTKFSASESAEALKYMAMAGWKTEDMLDGLEGIMNLAAASGEDLATTSDIITDALTAFGLSASDSGHFADILATASSNANTNVSMMGETFKYVAPIAGAMGYSAEDTALAIGLMANSGIKATQAGTALRSIITRLTKPTKESGMAMAALDIAITDSHGNMKSFGEILSDMQVAFSGLTEEEKATYAAMIGGQEAMSGLLAIVNAAPEDFNALQSAIEGCDGSSKEMADTMNNNLSGHITLLKSQLEGLAIQFVTLIMPYLKQFVEWLSKVCDWISGLDDGTKKMILTIAAFLAAAGPVLGFIGKVSSGIGGIISIGGKLFGGIGKLSGASGIGGLVSKIGGSLIPAIAAIPGPVKIVIAVLGGLVAAGVAVYKNWDDICAFCGKFFGGIRDTICGVVKNVTGFFVNLADGAKNMVSKVTGKFTELKDSVVSKTHEMAGKTVAKFVELKDKASAKVDELKKSVSDKFGKIKEDTATKIADLKENVVTGFKNLKEGAAEKISDLKEKWGSRFEEAREKVVSEVTELKEKAADKINEFSTSAVEKIGEFKNKTVQKFKEFSVEATTRLGDVVKKGVDGFNSIKEKGSAAVDNLKSVAAAKFSEMGETIRDKFGSVADKITGTFTKCRDSAHDIVEKIKGFFKFKWELPKIKLPHFSIDGKFSLNPPSIPKFGIEWYKKAMDSPMIMEEPTAFGISPTGRIRAGGEAGSEIVSGTDTLMQMISAAVAENNGRMYEMLEKIYALLDEYLPELAGLRVVMDSGALVGELAYPMYEQFGHIGHMRGRTN